MKILILSLCLLITSISSAQQTNNQLLGYQEFPTIIRGHATDSAGNHYYTGIFRGELKVNNQVLTAGEGQEDVFWVKTDATGKVIRFHTFGSPNVETAFTEALEYHANNTLTFAAQLLEPVNFQSKTVQPYINASNGLPISTTAIVQTDTAGNVKWVTRTTLPILKIRKVGDVIHAIGTINLFQITVKIGDSTLIPFTDKMGLVHLMLDTTGKLLNAKTIFAREADQIALQHFSNYRDGKLFMALRVTSKTSFGFNGQDVALPAFQGTYHVFINTDTSYTSYKARVINPLGHNLGGFNVGNIPVHLASNDSIYTVNEVEWGMPSNGAIVDYRIDGFPIYYLKNMLVVFDSSLKVNRTVDLGTAALTATPATSGKRRLYYQNITSRANTLYFTGRYLGTNESPINTIPRRDTSVQVLSGVPLTVDLNGPSLSFIAKMNLGVTNSQLVWYGDHSLYEYGNITVTNFHIAGRDQLFFTQSIDNVWNPWLFDLNLNTNSGSMKQNADRAESIQMVQYFSDGSRIVIGYAKGKTALDRNNNALRSNSLRNDAFICRILANGSISWFKRFHSTLLQADIRKLTIRNDKAYFLINYAGIVNDSNYVTVENQTYSTPYGASLLACASINGDISVLNLGQPTYQRANFRDFSFFSNGDLVLLCNNFGSSMPVGFPALPGFPLLRIDGSTGQFLGARMFVSNLIPPLNRIEVDKDDAIYFTYMVSPTSSAPGGLHTFRLHDGVKYVDSITVQHNPINSFGMHHGLMKMQWNKFIWFKRFSGESNTALTSPQDLFLVNQKPAILLNAQVENKPLYWDGQLVHNGSARNLSTWVQLDTAGALKNSKVLPNFYVTYARKGTNERMYISGYISRITTIDTISIGHSGFTDALGIVTDSNFIAKRSYRLHTPYAEGLYDFDIYRDSVVTFAYTGQTDPTVSTAKVNAVISDYDQNAYLSTLVIKEQTTTGINEPLPIGTSVAVTPNPVRDKNLQLSVSTPELLPTLVYLYTADGQLIGSHEVRITPCSNRYLIPLPESIKPGVYQVLISNKKWKTVRTFLKL